MAYETGQRIGDYEVVSLLGFGGMGRVYKVRSVISNREEAMKVLLPDFAAEADISARFMAEIRTLAGLDHPNIAQLRTAFQMQNEFVMIMEFVEGTTLETLASTSKIPLDQVLEYAMQVLSALSYAHSRGVIHRDLKPANVMVTSHGLVKLMDFGIAKSSEEKNLTRPGTTMGSVYYISPEQIRGGTVDARSDIYSFGVTLYEMLTGKKPFQAETSYSVLYAQMNEMPTPPMQVNTEVPAGLNDIVMHAIEKNPDARFQSAQEFRDALKGLRKQQGEAEGQAAGYAPVAAVAAAATPAQGMSATAAMSGGAAPQQPGYAPVPTVAPAAAQAQAGFAPVAAAPHQGYTPVAGSAPVAAKAANGNRGLWLGLGAVAAILVLVALASVLPRVYAIYASQKAAAAQAQAAQPAADASTQPSSTPAADAGSQAATPSTASPETPAAGTAGAAGAGSAPGAGPATKASSTGGSQSRPVYDKTHDGSGSASATTAASTDNAPAAPAGPSPKEIREVRDRLMNMDARADAARNGVQQLRRQQQAQGLDIRGDMLAAMNRMNNAMGEADRALGQNDLETAREYLDRAERELSKLEGFLGK